MLFCAIFSAAYHSTYKNIELFRNFDHFGISLLIAGTITPFIYELIHKNRKLMLYIVWSFVFANGSIRFYGYHPSHVFSGIIYACIGWLFAMVLLYVDYKEHWEQLKFIILGGLLYTIGVAFTAYDYSFHSVFHCFVVAASLIHYYAIRKMKRRCPHFTHSSGVDHLANGINVHL